MALTDNDIVKLLWEPVMSEGGMKTPRVSFGCVAANAIPTHLQDKNHSDENHYIFVLGGFNGRQVLSAVEVYDTKSGRWSGHAASMLRARSGCAAALVHDYIYVLGGRGEERGVLDSVERYHIPTDTWSWLPPMKHARAGCTAVTVGHRIYVLGGHHTIQTKTKQQDDISFTLLVDRVEIFDTWTLEWTEITTPMPTKRIGFGAVAVDCVDYHNDIQTYNRQSESNKRPRIYVFGGRTDSHQGRRVCLRTVEMLDVETHAWKNVGTMSTERYGCCCAVTMQYVMVMGGYNGCGKPLGTTEVFDTVHHTFSNVLPHMTTQRVGSCAVSFRTTIYLMGGLSGTKFLRSMEHMRVQPKEKKERPTEYSNTMVNGALTEDDALMIAIEESMRLNKDKYDSEKE